MNKDYSEEIRKLLYEKKPIKYKTVYSKESFEKLEQLIEEEWNKLTNRQKVGLLTKEEVDEKRRILGNFAIDGLGDKIYQLPGGGLTGQGGWDMIQEAFKKEFKNYGK